MAIGKRDAAESFTRETLEAAPPAFFAWLAKLFGPTTGRYGGLLTKEKP